MADRGVFTVVCEGDEMVCEGGYMSDFDRVWTVFEGGWVVD